jgi:hypothetical protein
LLPDFCYWPASDFGQCYVRVFATPSQRVVFLNIGPVCWENYVILVREVENRRAGLLCHLKFWTATPNGVELFVIHA